MVNLTDKDWERIKRVAPLQTDAVLLGGSAAEGFSNRQSDIDILVVYAGDTDPDRPSERLYSSDTTGQRIQVSSCSVARLEDLKAAVRRVRAAAPLERPVPLDDFSDDGLMWYYRIGTGEVLSDAAEQMPTIRDGMSMDDFGVVYSELCRWLALQSLSDSILDPHGHSVLTANALGEAVAWGAEAYLATLGEAYPRRKWLFEKARRRLGANSDFYRAAWALKARGDRDVAAYREAVCAFLVTIGIDPSDAEHVPTRRYQRHPGVRLLEVAGECYLVQHKAKLYRMPPEAVAIWAALEQPTTEADLAAALPPRARQYCVTLLFELTSRNLVTATR